MGKYQLKSVTYERFIGYLVVHATMESYAF
jgi:hypothetical protein